MSGEDVAILFNPCGFRIAAGLCSVAAVLVQLTAAVLYCRVGGKHATQDDAWSVLQADEKALRADVSCSLLRPSARLLCNTTALQPVSTQTHHNC